MKLNIRFLCLLLVIAMLVPMLFACDGDVNTEKEKTEEEKNIGWVEVIARFKQGNVTRNHHELGEFHKVNGAWFFYDGRGIKQETVKKTTPDVGRNDPCPCGSGKKYKKCCGQ